MFDDFLVFLLAIMIVYLVGAYLFGGSKKPKKRIVVKKKTTVDEKYLTKVANENAELNRILDKIFEHSMGSLSEKELNFLDNISKKYINKK